MKKWMQVIVVASLGFTSRNPQKSNEFEDLDDFLSQWRNSNLTMFNYIHSRMRGLERASDY
jgi:hypothetical protein